MVWGCIVILFISPVFFMFVFWGIKSKIDCSNSTRFPLDFIVPVYNTNISAATSVGKHHINDLTPISVGREDLNAKADSFTFMSSNGSKGAKYAFRIPEHAKKMALDDGFYIEEDTLQQQIIESRQSNFIFRYRVQDNVLTILYARYTPRHYLVPGALCGMLFSILLAIVGFGVSFSKNAVNRIELVASEAPKILASSNFIFALWCILYQSLAKDDFPVFYAVLLVLDTPAILLSKIADFGLPHEVWFILLGPLQYYLIGLMIRILVKRFKAA